MEKSVALDIQYVQITRIIVESDESNINVGWIMFRCIVVPNFDTKVTEYLCSGGFFFFRQILTF